jgi:hypothetical protein
VKYDCAACKRLASGVIYLATYQDTGGVE